MKSQVWHHGSTIVTHQFTCPWDLTTFPETSSASTNLPNIHVFRKMRFIKNWLVSAALSTRSKSQLGSQHMALLKLEPMHYQLLSMVIYSKSVINLVTRCFISWLRDSCRI